eukprot:1407561-Prymnesium_polylepis.1
MWEDEFSEYYDDDDDDAEGAADLATHRQRTAERKRALTQALYADEGVESRRRAELMALLEDLGEDALESPPPMPTETDTVGSDSAGVQML